MFLFSEGLDDTDGRGTGDCEGATENEANGIGDYFEYDYPPGVVDFDASLRGFLRVAGDFFDLLGCEFDFHDRNAFVLKIFGAKIKKRTLPRVECPIVRVEGIGCQSR